MCMSAYSTQKHIPVDSGTVSAHHSTDPNSCQSRPWPSARPKSTKSPGVLMGRRCLHLAWVPQDAHRCHLQDKTFPHLHPNMC